MVAPPFVGAFASAEPGDELALAPGRLDSLAALYQGGHRREAPALRDMPYGSAHALNRSPPTSFASQQVAGPRGSIFSPGVPRIIIRRPRHPPSDQWSRSHLVRIRAPLVRCVLLPGTGCAPPVPAGASAAFLATMPEGRSFFADPFRAPAPGAVSWALWRKVARLPALVDNPGTWRPLPYGKARNGMKALRKPPGAPLKHW